MYHCKRIGLSKGRQRGTDMFKPTDKDRLFLLTGSRTLPISRATTTHPYDHLLLERTNRGKSYREYLRESLTRTTERNYHKTYYETTITGITSATTRTQEEGSIDDPCGSDFLPD